MRSVCLPIGMWELEGLPLRELGLSRPMPTEVVVCQSLSSSVPAVGGRVGMPSPRSVRGPSEGGGALDAGSRGARGAAAGAPVDDTPAVGAPDGLVAALAAAAGMPPAATTVFESDAGIERLVSSGKRGGPGSRTCSAAIDSSCGARDE